MKSKLGGLVEFFNFVISCDILKVQQWVSNAAEHRCSRHGEAISQRPSESLSFASKPPKQAQVSQTTILVPTLTGSLIP
jgi:hypothetical protein